MEGNRLGLVYLTSQKGMDLDAHPYDTIIYTAQDLHPDGECQTGEISNETMYCNPLYSNTSDLKTFQNDIDDNVVAPAPPERPQTFQPIPMRDFTANETYRYTSVSSEKFLISPRTSTQSPDNEEAATLPKRMQRPPSMFSQWFHSPLQ